MTLDLLVGVQQNPDGTLDYSHAAVMYPDAAIADSTVASLKGELVINQEKENHYAHFEQTLQKMEHDEMVKWAVSFFNTLRMDQNQPPIIADDFKNVKLETESPEIIILRKQLGYEFKRPYFSLPLADFQKVYQKITGHTGSNGCVITGGAVDTNALTKGLNIVLASTISPDVVHELVHSVDPFLGTRKPQEKILEEFITFYRETFIPRVFITRSQARDKKGNPIGEERVRKKEVYEDLLSICTNLKTDLYSGYGDAFETKQNFYRKIDEIAAVISDIEDFFEDKIDVWKILLNARSLHDLEHLLNVLRKEQST